MQTIFYNSEGYIHGIKPFYDNVEKTHSLEITDQAYINLCCTPQHHAWKVLNGTLTLAVIEPEEHNAQVAKENAQRELEFINSWFADVYDVQMSQYARCQRLGIPYDCKHGTIAELDALAEGNAYRIKELKAILNS
jgi:hypothetical protein